MALQTLKFYSIGSDPGHNSDSEIWLVRISVVDMSNTPCLKTGLREVIVLIPSSSRDLFLNLTVKIFWKLVHICWSCRENESDTLFLRHGVSPFRYGARHFLSISLLQTSHTFTFFPFLPIPASHPIHLPLLFPSPPLSVSLFLCAVLFSKFVQPLLWFKLKSDDFVPKKLTLNLSALYI